MSTLNMSLAFVASVTVLELFPFSLPLSMLLWDGYLGYVTINKKLLVAPSPLVRSLSEANHVSHRILRWGGGVG